MYLFNRSATESSGDDSDSRSNSKDFVPGSPRNSFSPLSSQSPAEELINIPSESPLETNRFEEKSSKEAQEKVKTKSKRKIKKKDAGAEVLNLFLDEDDDSMSVFILIFCVILLFLIFSLILLF